MSVPAVRPRVGVIKFASCDGCQLQLLDLEDELLAVCRQFDIIEFAEASSSRSDGPFDVLFVEGSVSAPEHLPRIKELRAQAKFLVAIGACATSGGIQALRNWGDHDAFRSGIYAHPEFVASLATSTPIADHVAVDAELRGCPIDPRQLVELLTAITTGRRPQMRDEAVCMECKRAGNPCVMVTRHTPCLGQITQAGCGAIWPSFNRGCYGCFGPREHANLKGLAEFLQAQARLSDADLARLFSGFTAHAEPCRSAITRYGGGPPCVVLHDELKPSATTR
jgi:sulfhydrogenase subunit delta